MSDTLQELRQIRKLEKVIATQEELVRMIAKLNGPFPTGGQKTFCKRCGFYYLYDMFIHEGELMCGDCRYKARTGRDPSHELHPGFNGTGYSEDENVNEYVGGLGSKTLGRTQHYTVHSGQAVRMLEGILDGCKASLK